MTRAECEKPAAVLDSKPASNVDLLGGGVDLTNSIFPGPSQAPASRRLIGASAHWTPAAANTAIAAALLRALARKAGAR